MARALGDQPRVEDLPCPTVFAAHALCLTGAFERPQGCDLLVAAEGARSSGWSRPSSA